MKLVVVLTSVMLTVFAAASAQQEPRAATGDDFILRFPSEVDVRELSICIGQTRTSASEYHIDVRPKNAWHAINVADVDRLEVIILSRHYQAVLFKESDLHAAGARRGVDIVFKPLRSVRLAGKVVFPAGVDGTRFRLRAEYIWIEGMNFLGYADGMPPSFVVTETDLKPDGSFDLEVPDFWNDPVVGRDEDKGFFRFDLQPAAGRYSPDDVKQVNRDASWKVPVAAQYEAQTFRANAP